MNLLFTWKIIILLFLLANLASSDNNTTSFNSEDLFRNYIDNNHKVNGLTESSIYKQDFNVTDLFTATHCKHHKVNCPYVDINKVVPQNRECCKNLTRVFECSYKHRMQLLKYLNLLNSWNCSEQLRIECSSKIFNFNELSDKMYLSVCDPAKFNTTCEVQNSENSNSMLNAYSDNSKKIKDPCSTVRDFYNNGSETFVEIFFDFLTSCPITLYAFQSDNLEKFTKNILDIAPKRLVAFLVYFNYLVFFKLL